MMALIELVIIFGVVVGVVFLLTKAASTTESKTKKKTTSNEGTTDVDSKITQLTQELEELENSLPEDIKKHEQALERKKEELRKAQELKSKLK